VHSLEIGRPPILKVVKPGLEHWVVVNAVDGDGYSPDDYEIADPWDGRHKTLAAYTGDGWSLSYIVIFSKR